MNVSVMGAGYVGIVTAAGIASHGHNVTCVDVDATKVNKINNCKSPIYEKELNELLEKIVPSLLTATTDATESVTNADVVFLCVGTPTDEDGQQNTAHLREATETVGKCLAANKKYCVVAVKSTVVPGTTREIVLPLLEKTSGKKSGKDFGVVMNPEFLREGRALEEFMQPDRVIIGASDDKAYAIMEELYSQFDTHMIKTDPTTAEMVKYASNSFLATKISFINEVGNFCKKMGVDCHEVAKGMGYDKRIGPHFLNAGLGWGGSCFPKDVSAFLHESKRRGSEMRILEEVVKVNRRQPGQLVSLLLSKMKVGSLEGKKICALGLSFKGDTDDVRNSPAIEVIRLLLEASATVCAYDPQAEENAKKIIPESPKMRYEKSAQQAVDNGDAVVILTDWKSFATLNYEGKLVIDGRNIIPKNLREKIDYHGLCW